MVIKGKSRTNGPQLIAYLQKLKGNERVELLEHISRHDDILDTIREWEFLAEGVQGKKYLYHSQINPEARYPMTHEYWIHSADVLEKELGFEGQPRFIFLHQKHDGRQHAHVVWNRIDTETMTLIDDGWNYLAHERASLALEKEFGHEIVPGKHAKRDREQQPEFPRSELAEHDRHVAERSGLDPHARQEAITALFQQSDSGQAFAAALAEAGYILAKGDRRDYVILDLAGEIHSLGRQIEGVKAKELRAFMSGIDPHTLPTTAEAKEQAKALYEQDFLAAQKADQLKASLDEEARQMKERHKAEIRQVFETTKEDIARDIEARRALQDAELAKFFTKAEEFSDDWMKKLIAVQQQRWNWDVADQARLNRQQEIGEIKARHRIERDTLIQTMKQERDQQIEDLKAARAVQRGTEEPSMAAKAAEEYKLTPDERAALTKAVNDRHAQEAQRIKDIQDAELRQLKDVADREITRKLSDLDALQSTERDRKSRELYPERDTLDKFIEAIKRRLDPAGVARDLAARDRQWEAMIDRQEQKRADTQARLYQDKQREVEEAQERHAQKQRELKAQADVELARYIREQEAAKKLLADIERQQRQEEERRQQRDGPEPPTPTR